MLEVILIGIMIGYLRKGRLSRFEEMNIKLWELFPLAFLLQFLGNRISMSDFTFYLVHLSSYVIILIVLFLNRRFFALRIFAIGHIMNMLAIGFNQGKMPVDVGFLKNPIFDRGHSLLQEGTNLKILCDIFVVRIPGITIRAYSLGDFFIMAGIFLLIQKIMLFEKTE